MSFGAWGREALNEILILSAVYRIYYRSYCHPHLHGLYFGPMVDIDFCLL